MNREILRRMQTSLTGVATLIGSLCLTKPVTLLAQRSLTSDEPIFREALEHASWFNWADAAAEFEEAEKRFLSRRDHRNALYARVGILRATMENHSLAEVRERLVQIREMPEVQSDPDLLLFTCIAEADVDGN